MAEQTFDFKIDLPREVQFALEVLDKGGFKAYVVGGAVRDSLMGIKPHDFDVSSPSTPNQTMRLFPGYEIERSGLKHGTVRVIIHHYPVEITSFRTEDGYKDFRHPSEVSFISSPFEDSKRRDFTINAFYYRDGKITDFHDGLTDLKDKVIRAIGNPEQRFKEDALRILRALRFASELKFTIEPKTKQAMADCAEELFDISEERIEGETLRMAAYDDFLNTVKDNRKVFSVIFQGSEKIPDDKLLSKTVNDPYVNLAILLNLMDYDQKTADELLRKLKFSVLNGKAIESLLAIDKKWTLKSLLESTLSYRLFLLNTYPLNPETALDFVYIRDAVNKQDVSCYDQAKDRLNEAEIGKAPVSKKDLMVTGNDLKHIGFKEGPEFKALMNELLLEVNQEKIGSGRKEQLDWLKKKRFEANHK